MAISDLTKEEILNYIKEKRSICSILNESGYNSNGSGAYKVFKQHCNSLGIDYIAENAGSNTFKPKARAEDIFRENSTFAPSHMKKRVIKDELIPYKCAECGNSGEWNGKKLVLQIDHINGINNDHRLENLQFLCPNCHTQTDTYSSKRLNKKYKSVG